MFDCARANKSLAAWGVEGRVPFLDKEFIDVAMRLNPQDKMCGNGKMEKHILRECFEHYLPDSIAWRQKEQFSDGVGYSWIDTLKEVAESKITDQQMETAKFRFPYNTPTTKEGYVYREIFEELFPSAIGSRMCTRRTFCRLFFSKKRLSGMNLSKTVWIHQEEQFRQCTMTLTEPKASSNCI